MIVHWSQVKNCDSYYQFKITLKEIIITPNLSIQTL